MAPKNSFLRRVAALLRRSRAERDLGDELSFHVEMETRKLTSAGMSRDEAQAVARARFGSMAVAAEDCREARGLSFVDTLRQDITFAFRSFRRAPGVALTVVGTIALGLGLLVAVFTVFNTFVFREARVVDPGSLVAVEHIPLDGATRVPFTRPQYESLRRETSSFSDAFAMMAGISSRIGGRMMEGHLVTGNFFSMLGGQVQLGRPLTMDDDGTPPGAAALVLSHNGWMRLFAGDPAIVGRTIVVSGVSYQVVGVTSPEFIGIELVAPDYWAPLAGVGRFRPWLLGQEERAGVMVVGRLAPGVSRDAARAELNVWASRQAGTNEPGRSLIRLESRRTPLTLSPQVVAAFSPLFFAFGLVLLIGCANVTNLLLARAVARQREIGIRLSLGAPRRRIVRQLVTESVVLGLAAVAGAVAVSRLVIDGSTLALARTLPPELVELLGAINPSMAATDWRVWAFAVAAAVGASMFFGLLPALAGTRLDLVRTMRGEVGRAGARPGRLRSVLMVAQVTAAALLLICAGVFLRSAIRSAAADPGLRLANNILIDVVNEPLRPALIDAVRTSPDVTAVAASAPEVLGGRPRTAIGASTSGSASSPVAYRLVSPEFFDVLEVDILRGRTFTPAEAESSAPVALVSESIARQLWPEDSAIGQPLRLTRDAQPGAVRNAGNDLPAGPATVIGVVRDVAGIRIAGPEANVFLPATLATEDAALIARVSGDTEQARGRLVERLVAVDPNMGMVMSLETMGRLSTYPLQIGFWLAISLGGLALALTLAGLFGMVSYLAEQRAKEIGVRVALGATAVSILRMMIWQSLRLVVVGLVAGAGLAVMLASLLMTTPAAGTIRGFVGVFDAPAYAGSAAIVLLGCLAAATLPAIRAASVDPVRTLRRE